MHKLIEIARARLTYANVVASAALFVALGGVSYAATQLPKNSVGTAQIKNGAVTKAKLDATASKSLAGAVGAQGRAGADGTAGTPGADGATGPAGSRGETGATGAGLPGAPGAPGADGADGVQGAAGPAGSQGETGATGAGLPGAPGAPGAAGADGEDGATGLTGPAGADGDDGARGATGAAGPAGADGEDGAPGPAGPAGDDGAQGATGATGPAGPALGDYAYAASNVSKSIPSSGQTALTFPDGKFLDGWTMPDDSTFRVPTTARYRVSYSINVSVSGSAQASLGLWLNGVRRQDTEASNFAQGSYSMMASRVLMLDLTAANTLQLLVWNTNGAGTINAGGNSSISIERVA